MVKVLLIEPATKTTTHTPFLGSYIHYTSISKISNLSFLCLCFSVFQCPKVAVSVNGCKLEKRTRDDDGVTVRGAWVKDPLSSINHVFYLQSSGKTLQVRNCLKLC